MGKKRWFRFHVDRWFNGTFGLKPNEVAAYITIICELYDNDGEIDLKFDVMARRCGMRPSSFKKSVNALVDAGKLDIKSGKITNEMVSQELAEISKLGQNSFKTRSKVGQNAPKNPLKSKARNTHTENRIQRTEEKQDFSYFLSGVDVSFTKEEIENLIKAYPHVEVVKKLSQESFIGWAINQDPSQPKNVICKWFMSKNNSNRFEANNTGGFKKISFNAEDMIQ